jgi:hypothetical protein
MRRMQALLLALALLAPVHSQTGDKEQPQSLEAQAALLGARNGQKGWAVEDITFTKDGGKTKAPGKIYLKFAATRDKATGGLYLLVVIEPRPGQATMVVWGGTTGSRFDLVEKDGKRFLKIMEPQKGAKPDPNPKVVETLEYTLKGEELTLQNAALFNGAGWEQDLTKPLVFKAPREWLGNLKEDEPQKEAPTQINDNVGYLTDAKAWEKLWKAWRGKEELPKVDFDKELVVVVTVSGPYPVVVGQEVKNGDLRLKANTGYAKVSGFGFGYYLAVVPRKDFKTINGKMVEGK